MTSPTRIECAIRTKTKRAVDTRPRPLPAGRVPRITRPLALAHKFDNLLRQKVVPNYAALAHLGHVSMACPGASPGKRFHGPSSMPLTVRRNVLTTSASVIL